MRGRRTLILGLVVVLSLTAVATLGCGGPTDEEKAALSAALDNVENQVGGLYDAMEAGGTVADLKAAKEQIAPAWEAVVTAAQPFKDADIAELQKAWTDAAAAIDSVPDNASLMQAAGIVMGPVNALLTLEAELRMLVGPTE